MKYRTLALVVACAVPLVVAGVTARDAAARLAKSKLSDLIDDSTLIIESTPVRIGRTGAQAGYARLKVLRVVYGAYKGDHIEIEWGNEVHDHQISSLDFDRLLFLKKKSSGGFTGTQYGRSYWPLTSRVTDARTADLSSSHRQVRYDYPVTRVTFSAAEKRRLMSGTGKDRHVRMKKLVEYIGKRKAAKKR